MVTSLGFKTIPVTVLGDRAVGGFDVPALRDLLGLAPDSAASLTPAQMLEKYRLIFTAAQRAIMQIPHEKLDAVTPGRERTLRQLTWHIFDRAEDFAALADGGEFTAEMTTGYMTRAESYRTSAEIAAYGQEVLIKLGDLLTDRAQLLDKHVDTYFGVNTLYNLLSRALSMAAFRLRGTYVYMRMLGIEPVQPLGDDDYSGIFMPPGNP